MAVRALAMHVSNLNLHMVPRAPWDLLQVQLPQPPTSQDSSVRCMRRSGFGLWHCICLLEHCQERIQRIGSNIYPLYPAVWPKTKTWGWRDSAAGKVLGLARDWTYT